MRSITSRRYSCLDGRRGAATVEFALIAPFFLVLLGGIIEFGQAFRIQHSLSTAARQGARAAIISGATSSQVAKKVQDHCAMTLGISGSAVKVEVMANGQKCENLSQLEEQCAISVRVSIPYSQAGVGFFSNTFSTSTLKSSCTLEKE